MEWKFEDKRSDIRFIEILFTRSFLSLLICQGKKDQSEGSHVKGLDEQITCVTSP